MTRKSFSSLCLVARQIRHKTKRCTVHAQLEILCKTVRKWTPNQRIANYFVHSFSRSSWFGNRSKFLSLKNNLSKTQLDQTKAHVWSLWQLWHMSDVSIRFVTTAMALCQDFAKTHGLSLHLPMTCSHTCDSPDLTGLTEGDPCIVMTLHSLHPTQTPIRCKRRWVTDTIGTIVSWSKGYFIFWSSIVFTGKDLTVTCFPKV